MSHMEYICWLPPVAWTVRAAALTSLSFCVKGNLVPSKTAVHARIGGVAKQIKS